MLMPTRSIVERIDVICDVGNREFAILVNLFLDAFLLQTAEERLGDGWPFPRYIPGLKQLFVRKIPGPSLRRPCTFVHVPFLAAHFQSAA
jgi:hypothetical protein